jgi:alkanesulfonate monooxygenase SsuD/methylene tetrahydromethanopterin reductase-like flavin-dependent oxidoreductase (luciferase family)
MQFGAFIGPKADDIAGIRERVLAAERSGFDFVSIQDHPYARTYLDTFSLIANLAATTSTLRFMTDVANLPLRPAPMLAKAAASIDRLSNGRFDLGLGAGRMWTEIERMGGPTWTPGQAISAVSEAIDTLRTAWGFEGEDGAAPGVAPAHRIAIWVGGGGPRMLDLIGRKADGWIAPMATGYETKPIGQDRIDAAATGAGRTPAAVGRMIQLVGRITDTASTISRPRSGPGNQSIHTTADHWARIVAEFALEERFDAVNFIFEDETSDQIIRFGTEVVAAAKDALANGALARSTRSATGSTNHRLSPPSVQNAVDTRPYPVPCFLAGNAGHQQGVVLRVLVPYRSDHGQRDGLLVHGPARG